MSLGEVAALLTALGAILGGLLTWSTNQVTNQSKIWEGRVKSLEDAVDDGEKRAKEAREDSERRFADLHREFDRQRDDWERQMTDMRRSLEQQAITIHRQEAMLSDHVRHISKLERVMAAANLAIPEFEVTDYAKFARAGNV